MIEFIVVSVTTVTVIMLLIKIIGEVYEVHVDKKSHRELDENRKRKELELEYIDQLVKRGADINEVIK